MATRMQQRRGTAAQWTSADPILEAGEIGFEIDTNKFKIGDGVNHWEDLIYYASAADLSALVDNAPGLLNTLNEIAAAIGDDPDFITSVGNDIANAITTSQAYTDNAISTVVPTMISNVVTAHSDDTTNVHGIANTAALATISNLEGEISTLQTYVDTQITNTQGYADNAISTHSSDTTSVHGISDTANLVYQTDLDAHDSTTTNVHGIANTAALVTLSGTQTLSNKTLEYPSITVDVVGLPVTISSTELSYLENVTSSIQTQLDAKATATDIQDHNAETANVHGIANTADLFTTSGGTISGSVTITGDLTVTGNTVTVSANSLVVNDPLIYMGEDNNANSVDLGFVASFDDGTYQHTGLVRDASDNVWKLFKGVTDEPTTTINFGQGSLDTLAVEGIKFSDGTQTKEGVPSRTTIVMIDDLVNTSPHTLDSLSLRDNLIEVASAGAFTIKIPTNAAIAYPVGTSFDILQTGSGQVTIAGDTGVTVNATPGLKLRTQWSSATLFKRDTNSWVVFGDLMA